MQRTFSPKRKRVEPLFLGKIDDYSIDPTALTPEDKIIFIKLLEGQVNEVNYRIFKNERIPFPKFTQEELNQLNLEKRYRSVSLKFQVEIRECSSDINVWHFEVFNGQKIGSSVNGCPGVRKATHTGKLQKQTDGSFKLINIKPTMLVAKDIILEKQTIKDEEKEEELLIKSMLNEYQLTHRVMRGVKQPTFFKSANPKSCTMVMPFLEGTNLDSLIAHDQTHKAKGSNPLQTLWRILIAKGIIREVRRLHINKILHRDLAPQNIKVIGAKIKVLDFGLSCDLENFDAEQPGTLLYAAPECYTTGDILTMKSDIFSVQRILLEVFRATFPNVSYDPKIPGAGPKATKKAADFTFFEGNDFVKIGLFDGIDDLDTKEIELLIDLFEGMGEIEPAERISLDDAMQIIEDLEVQRVLRITKPEDRVEFATGFTAGIEFRKKLDQFLSNHQLVTVENAQELKTLYLTALQSTPNTPKTIHAFISRLDNEDGILDKLSSHEAVTKVVCDYIHRFIEAQAELNHWLNMLEEACSNRFEPNTQLSSLLENINLVLIKSKNMLPSLANIAQLGHSYEKCAKKTEQALADLNLLGQPENTSRCTP